jgi:carbamoyl-phosphate synthase large subunit
MEHIEQAGVHSGDSACSIPSRTISTEHLAQINDYTARIARTLKVVGLINVQYAICDGKVYILEANPRASRTVPIVSKVTGVFIARIATQLMLGKKIKVFTYKPKSTFKKTKGHRSRLTKLTIDSIALSDEKEANDGA